MRKKNVRYEKERKYYHMPPGAILLILITIPLLAMGLFFLIEAGRHSRTMDLLVQRGRSLNAKITNVTFKALDRMGNTYGSVSFRYEYEGQAYELTQSIEQIPAQDLLKGSTQPHVLVLPENHRCARLANAKNTPYYDPTRRRLNGFLLIGLAGLFWIVYLLMLFRFLA